MKQLTCEMCGSVDLIKDGGYFVCQFCKTKYSVEEAKKMMIEGTVDVQGTVKVDNTDTVAKYLQNARRAKAKEDWAETEKYYNLVEQNAPDNIEAIFYSAFGKAKNTLIESDIYKREAAFKVLQNSVSVLDDNFDVAKESEERAIISQINDDIFNMVCSSFVYNQTKNGYGVVVKNDMDVTITLFNGLEKEFMITLENIAKKLEKGEDKVFYYNICLRHAEFMLSHKRVADKVGWRSIALTYHKQIQEIDPSHVIPQTLLDAKAKDEARADKNEKRMEKMKKRFNMRVLSISAICGAILTLAVGIMGTFCAIGMAVASIIMGKREKAELGEVKLFHLWLTLDIIAMVLSIPLTVVWFGMMIV